MSRVLAQHKVLFLQTLCLTYDFCSNYYSLGTWIDNVTLRKVEELDIDVLEPVWIDGGWRESGEK